MVRVLFVIINVQERASGESADAPDNHIELMTFDVEIVRGKQVGGPVHFFIK